MPGPPSDQVVDHLPVLPGGNSGQDGTEHKSMGQNYDLQEQSLLNYHELAYFLFRFQVTHNHHNFSAKLKPSSCLGTSTFITVTM